MDVIFAVAIQKPRIKKRSCQKGPKGAKRGYQKTTLLTFYALLQKSPQLFL